MLTPGLCWCAGVSTDPFSVVLGVLWKHWSTLGKTRDPFQLPPLRRRDLVTAMTRAGLANPDQALAELQDRCLIYQAKKHAYRLVYSHMLEQYDRLVDNQKKNTLTLQQIYNLLPDTGRRNEAEELDVLRYVAEQHGAELVADIGVSQIQRDVQARARRTGAAGQCLYKLRDASRSGTYARDGTTGGGLWGSAGLNRWGWR